MVCGGALKPLLRGTATACSLICNGTWPLHPAADFTIVAVPDTQFYVMNTGYSGSWQYEWVAQADWLAEQVEKLKVKAVIHLGDIVEFSTDPEQWHRFLQNWRKIEDSGVAWSVVPGNHDLVTMWDPWGQHRWDLYNYYMSDSWQRNPYLQEGFPEGKYENTLVFFETDGLEFMILGLELGPRQATLDWAGWHLDKNPQKHAIILVHYVDWLLHEGPNVADFAKHFRNVFMIHQGHSCAREWYKTFNNIWGEPIIEIMSDYQCTGDGYLRYYSFRLRDAQVDAHTYSPSLGCYETDADSQFTFAFNPDRLKDIVKQDGNSTMTTAAETLLMP
eukprot:TRINITY_DN21550_c0_g1_i2.p1 TRINITY_DN21550_c0_g1~~TRINITY_DN21550_c0_g1_i2.p1  ORF type:complete len:332 (-),score=58.92 TRINITY_DN21550_c0_g1_i2:821-1816(-)